MSTRFIHLHASWHQSVTIFPSPSDEITKMTAGQFGLLISVSIALGTLFAFILIELGDASTPLLKLTLDGVKSTLALIKKLPALSKKLFAALSDTSLLCPVDSLDFCIDRAVDLCQITRRVLDKNENLIKAIRGFLDYLEKDLDLPVSPIELSPVELPASPRSSSYVPSRSTSPSGETAPSTAPSPLLASEALCSHPGIKNASSYAVPPTKTFRTYQRGRVGRAESTARLRRRWAR